MAQGTASKKRSLVERAWRWLLNEKHQKVLGLLGSGLSALVVAGWVLFGYFSPQPSVQDVSATSHDFLLTGVVIDEVTTRPIAGANVTLSPEAAQQRTTDDGRFTFRVVSRVPEVSIGVRVEAPGYWPGAKLINLLLPTTEIKIPVRSSASANLRRLMGEWVFTSDDGKARALLRLNEFKSSTELRGSVDVTAVADRLVGPITPGQVMCRTSLKIAIQELVEDEYDLVVVGNDASSYEFSTGDCLLTTQSGWRMRWMDGSIGLFEFPDDRYPLLVFESNGAQPQISTLSLGDRTKYYLAQRRRERPTWRSSRLLTYPLNAASVGRGCC